MRIVKIKSVNNNVCTTDTNETLYIAGNNNVEVGSYQYTDGTVIYGNRTLGDSPYIPTNILNGYLYLQNNLDGSQVLYCINSKLEPKAILTLDKQRITSITCADGICYVTIDKKVYLVGTDEVYEDIDAVTSAVSNDGQFIYLTETKNYSSDTESGKAVLQYRKVDENGKYINGIDAHRGMCGNHSFSVMDKVSSGEYVYLYPERIAEEREYFTGSYYIGYNSGGFILDEAKDYIVSNADGSLTNKFSAYGLIPFSNNSTWYKNDELTRIKSKWVEDGNKFTFDGDIFTYKPAFQYRFLKSDGSISWYGDLYGETFNILQLRDKADSIREQYKNYLEDYARNKANNLTEKDYALGHDSNYYLGGAFFTESMNEAGNKFDIWDVVPIKTKGFWSFSSFKDREIVDTTSNYNVNSVIVNSNFYTKIDDYLTEITSPKGAFTYPKTVDDMGYETLNDGAVAVVYITHWMLFKDTTINDGVYLYQYPSGYEMYNAVKGKYLPDMEKANSDVVWHPRLPYLPNIPWLKSKEKHNFYKFGAKSDDEPDSVEYVASPFNQNSASASGFRLKNGEYNYTSRACMPAISNLEWEYSFLDNRAVYYNPKTGNYDGSPNKDEDGNDVVFNYDFVKNYNGEYFTKGKGKFEFYSDMETPNSKHILHCKVDRRDEDHYTIIENLKDDEGEVVYSQEVKNSFLPHIQSVYDIEADEGTNYLINVRNTTKGEFNNTYSLIYVEGKKARILLTSQAAKGLKTNNANPTQCIGYFSNVRKIAKQIRELISEE